MRFCRTLLEKFVVLFNMDKQLKTPRRSSEASEKSLPPPPPDPQFESRFRDKIKDSSCALQRCELPEPYQRLLNSVEREQNFHKILDDSIASDCLKFKSECSDTSSNSESLTKFSLKGKNSAKPINRFPEFSALLKRECEEFIEPLQNRLRPSITAALAAYDAIEQLNRLHAMLDDLCVLQEQLYQRKVCLQYAKELNERRKLVEKVGPNL